MTAACGPRSIPAEWVGFLGSHRAVLAVGAVGRVVALEGSRAHSGRVGAEITRAVAGQLIEACAEGTRCEWAAWWQGVTRALRAGPSGTGVEISVLEHGTMLGRWRVAAVRLPALADLLRDAVTEAARR
ncbi:hypothetical protein FHR81_002812 [Actinoalloteichus hoggarensis]|uniref:Uncharacterized protein n=1 Tax=Actinoalloteichus hoggarensis TaxID=1470176 RepID=A0A221VY50_9PSEU|nr:hypothetical protein [Actinoalloteichus hoggarensis]ASO18408.1 hypothetical protein AHOG_03760 [Actinoalloteichus hoggarensis]MBB5921772.1 hypothetical protein [Actinoalloteichus hoggarensis]